MKKKEKRVISITVVIIIITIVAGIIYFYNTQPTPPDELKSQWISSGPFAIDKPKYRLGENIFLVVSNLKPDEIGSISFVLPNGKTYADISFNGTTKDNFKYYFTPTTSAPRKIYKPEQLTGNWTVIFHEVPYEPLKFEILNEYIKGGERNVPNLEEFNKTST